MNRINFLNEMNELSKKYDITFEINQHGLKLTKIDTEYQYRYSQLISTELLEMGLTSLEVIIEQFIENFNKELEAKIENRKYKLKELEKDIY